MPGGVAKMMSQATVFYWSPSYNVVAKCSVWNAKDIGGFIAENETASTCRKSMSRRPARPFWTAPTARCSATSASRAMFLVELMGAAKGGAVTVKSVMSPALTV